MESNVVSRPHSRLKFDVFLSFQGEETRDNIANLLFVALKEKKVRVFQDIEIGEDIQQSIIEAMENSAAYIVVLSSNYTASRWCLYELATICDLSSSLRRPLFPIFYQVDPSHVRKQSHDIVEDFRPYATRFSDECIQRWRRALNLVGNLSGFVFSPYGSDVDMDMKIGLVVKWVLAELGKTPEEVGEYTVGLESRVEDLKNLLDTKPVSHVQMLGLYGMGGIGKTTLAKALYNNIVGDFKERAFISNVRERSSDPDGLQRSFISELFGLQVKHVNRDRDKIIRERASGKKILVVLDDVDKVDQVDALVGERSCYGEGSVIVITTRDEEILTKLSVNQKYEVQCLTEMQALKLFSYHSLRKENPTKSLLDLSQKIVQIAGLLPLSLEVVGSLLYDKIERREWQVQLRKLKMIQPNNNLEDVLALSFKSLNDEEKQVFLDIACLFLGMEMTKEDVVDLLNGCGFKAEAVLKVLRQKSLVKITAEGTLWMHDQIKDMARLMDVRENSGMQSRLCDHVEIMAILNDPKGTTSIEGIVFDFTKRVDGMALRNLQNNSVCNYLRNKFIRCQDEEKPETTIRVDSFVPMTKLRLLQINHMKLKGNLKLLPSGLKWIQWKGCPLKNLPPEFLSGQLAVLDLSESGIIRVQSLSSRGVVENLKVVNLSGCHRLKAIPDLSQHKAIEKLVLERCTLLVKVPRSVGHLTTLLHLDLRNCPKLAEFLVDVSGLKHLEKLFLSGCSNLRTLPENIGAMQCLKELLLDGTAIDNLPETTHRLKNLEKLSLKGCRFIKQLPLLVGDLGSLEELYLDDTALENLPSSIGYLKNLQKLHLVRCTSLFEIPDTINELISLKELFINESSVKELPLKPDSLPCLTDFLAGGCKFLEQVPRTIGGLYSLLRLQLNNTPIEALPYEIGDLHFIRKLELSNCKSLYYLPGSTCNMDTLESLHLEGSDIGELPEDFGELENLVLLQMNKCKWLKRLPESFGGLKSLRHLYMEETSVAELPKSFGNLSNLRVLKMQKRPLFRRSESDAPEPRFAVPNSISNLVLLEELDARSCRIWDKLPDDFEKLSSMRILNLGNNYFHSLPSSLEGLSNLRELSLYDCRELVCVPLLPWKLEKLNLANCFALESISDLSKLEILQDLNLTNCEKVVDIPGLEHLTALQRLCMSGCNSSCSSAVKKRLSKVLQVSSKIMRNLSLPGNRIPDWFSQGPVTFSAQRNRELKGIIIAVVVALNKETRADYMLPDVIGVQAQILKLGVLLHAHTLHLSRVPRTNDDQLHIFQFSALHPLVTVLKDGYTLVIKRVTPFKQGVELKMHGIHLVYDGEDDSKSNERLLTETQLSVPQKLGNFFSSFEEVCR
ncbi:unnamed protein product [Microthlaspi erraticum]|uniref:TIR domain-containing protein n=1 Tax=Microthlaspi erraticum TaxID=1685480 RepID=A0A6D2IHM3_9BRAS|nr:unnamed protein product [Microthlaspi erraticum]CAA7032551.1 unnamed protein product [Microthlaspi erraticum]